MSRKSVYFIAQKKKNVVSIIIPFLNMRVSSRQGIIKPTPLSYKLHRLQCYIDFEDNLEYLLTSLGYSEWSNKTEFIENENFILVFEILKAKINQQKVTKNIFVKSKRK